MLFKGVYGFLWSLGRHPMRMDLCSKGWYRTIPDSARGGAAAKPKIRHILCPVRLMMLIKFFINASNCILIYPSFVNTGPWQSRAGNNGLCLGASPGSVSVAIPAKFVAPLIHTSITAVAFYLWYAVGSQQIFRHTIRFPIRKGSRTKSRRHLTRQIVVVKIQLFQISQLSQGGGNGSGKLVAVQIKTCQSG